MTWLDFAGGVTLFLILIFISHRKGILAFNIKAGDHEGMGSLSQVNYFKDLCREAKENLYVVSGETAHVFWEKDEVIKALKDALARGVRVQICAGPWFDVRSKRLAQLINNGRVAYYKLAQRNNEIHFWANDSGYLAYHDPIEQDREHIITGSRFLNQKYINKFYDFTRGLSPIPTMGFKDAFYIQDVKRRQELETDYEFTDKDYQKVAPLQESHELIAFSLVPITN